MSIVYPVDVAGSRWSVLDSETGDIVGRNKVWPVADGSEIPGLDPRYVYLLQSRDTEPSFDSRLWFIQSSELVDEAGNSIHVSHETIKRSVDEQKSAAENEEASRLTGIVVVERELLETRLMVGAILAYIVDNQQFPPKVRALAEEYVVKATRVWNNRDRLDAILAEIDGGTEPDLDVGWDETVG